MCLQRNIVMCTDSPFANMRCDHFNCFAFCIVSLSVCTMCLCIVFLSLSLSSLNMASKSSRGMRVTTIIIAHCKQFTVEESLLYFPLSTTTSPLSTQRQFDSAIVQLFSFRSDVDMTTWSVNRCRGSTARLHFHVLIVFISFVFSFFILSSKCFKSGPFYYRHSFLANPRFIYAPNVIFVLLCCRCSLKETFFLFLSSLLLSANGTVRLVLIRSDSTATAMVIVKVTTINMLKLRNSVWTEFDRKIDKILRKYFRFLPFYNAFVTVLCVTFCVRSSFFRTYVENALTLNNEPTKIEKQFLPRSRLVRTGMT